MAVPTKCPAVVLVVDDEPLLRIEIAQALEAAGCTVFEAEHSKAALIAFEQHPEISALFTDINMPGESGLALAKIVHDQRPDVHVVITSGLEQPSCTDMPQAGVFIGKPYSADEVAVSICSMIASGPAGPGDPSGD